MRPGSNVGPLLFQGLVTVFRLARQASEQYSTSSQTLAHFFLQVKGLPQTLQSF